jgi:hypothetical protein
VCARSGHQLAHFLTLGVENAKKACRIVYMCIAHMYGSSRARGANARSTSTRRHLLNHGTLSVDPTRCPRSFPLLSMVGVVEYQRHDAKHMGDQYFTPALNACTRGATFASRRKRQQPSKWAELRTRGVQNAVSTLFQCQSPASQQALRPDPFEAAAPLFTCKVHIKLAQRCAPPLPY